MEGAHCNAILENPASPRVHQGLDLFDLFLEAQGNWGLAVPALTLMEGNEFHHLIRKRPQEWHSHEKRSYTPQDGRHFSGRHASMEEKLAQFPAHQLQFVAGNLKMPSDEIDVKTQMIDFLHWCQHRFLDIHFQSSLL